jgi:hypothetical protein
LRTAAPSLTCCSFGHLLRSEAHFEATSSGGRLAALAARCLLLRVNAALP